jgi:aspartate/methionine/tyrosine aminotransferase
VRDRCVVVDGVSKAFAMTGWRVGWLVAPAELARRAASLQSHVTSNVNNVAQAAAAAALEGDRAALEAMRDAYARRRRILCEAIGDLDGVECVRPAGAFYLFPSFARHIGRTLRGARVETTADLAGGLLRHAGVAVVPGEAFGTPGFVRLSYALADDRLIDGVERIRAYLADRRPS